MACTISTGKARYCKVQPGGIDKVYVIARFDDASAKTLALTDGVLTATSGLTSQDGAAGTYFQFDTDPYLSSLNQTIVVNEGGGVGFQQDLELVFKGVYGKADVTMQNLSNGSWQIVVEDNTGTLYFCGLGKGMIATGGSFDKNMIQTVVGIEGGKVEVVDGKGADRTYGPEDLVIITGYANESLDEKKQGYNDELDDSEGAKHGKKKQSMAQRRADSENMEKADGKRKYSGDKSKDLNESVVFPMWNKIK